MSRPITFIIMMRTFWKFFHSNILDSDKKDVNLLNKPFFERVHLQLKRYVVDIFNLISTVQLLVEYSLSTQLIRINHSNFWFKFKFVCTRQILLFTIRKFFGMEFYSNKPVSEEKIGLTENLHCLHKVFGLKLLIKNGWKHTATITVHYICTVAFHMYV